MVEVNVHELVNTEKLTFPMSGKLKRRLSILTGKTVFLLNSVQEFIEAKAWLLLNFFLCLHNQLISITFYCHILKSTDV